MFKEYLSKEEAAKALSPYKEGQEFTLKREVKTGEGIHAEGTKVTLAEVAFNEDVLKTLYRIGIEPNIVKGEEGEWFAETDMFDYTLLTEDGKKIRKVDASDFAEKVISPSRKEARQAKNKWYLKLVLLSAASIIAGVLLGVFVSFPYVFIGIVACVIPYKMAEELAEDCYMPYHLLTRITEMK